MPLPLIISTPTLEGSTLQAYLLASPWKLAPELACKVVAARDHAVCTYAPFMIRIISGVRTLAQEQQLQAEGKPTPANPADSYHIPCPGTDVSRAADFDVLPNDATSWAAWGASLRAVGLEWGGGSPIGADGFPTDKGHAELPGPKCP